MGAYENDPSVGKYVNQDGLQQLRHYLKVGPYKSFLSGQPKNAFFGYLRQVMKRKRNVDPNDYAESLRTLKIAADAASALTNITSSSENNIHKRNRKWNRDLKLSPSNIIDNNGSHSTNNTHSSPLTTLHSSSDCGNSSQSTNSHTSNTPGESSNILGKVKFVNLNVP